MKPSITQVNKQRYIKIDCKNLAVSAAHLHNFCKVYDGVLHFLYYYTLC